MLLGRVCDRDGDVAGLLRDRLLCCTNFVVLRFHLIVLLLMVLFRGSGSGDRDGLSLLGFLGPVRGGIRALDRVVDECFQLLCALVRMDADAPDVGAAIVKVHCLVLRRDPISRLAVDKFHACHVCGEWIAEHRDNFASVVSLPILVETDRCLFLVITLTGSPCRSLFVLRFGVLADGAIATVEA